MGTRVWGRKRRRIYWLMPTIGLGIVLLLAGCSSNGGTSSGTNITLGLAGSTADHPGAPPSVASNGPTDAYAFVYDDQIWVHKSNANAPTQVTHLELSNGADIAFGPLVWSPDDSQIAFALVENLTPSAPDRTAGPIYVVNISTITPTTVVTPGIGSIYGHNYAWYGSHLLFYASGDGISMYDIGDPDPRVWQVLTAITSQDGQTFSNNNDVFGDIAITSDSNLFYSEAQITTLGGTGVIGTAGVYEILLPFSLAAYNSEYSAYYQNSPIYIPEWLYQRFQQTDNAGYQAASLGIAYSDTSGTITMGSWQVSSSDKSMVRQVIDDVDTKAATVSSHFCVSSSGNFTGCSQVLAEAKTCAQSLHGQLSLSPDTSHIAFTCDTLYVQATAAGSSASKLASTGWTTPAAMTANGLLTVATQIVSSSRDSNGVLRTETNLVAFFDGKNDFVLIKGAQDASWQ